MKVLIDISCETYERATRNSAYGIATDVERAVANGEVLDNATNKDVFETVFGYEPATDSVVCNKEDWCGASEPCNYCMSNPDNIGKEEDFWNAKYRKVEE